MNNRNIFYIGTYITFYREIVVQVLNYLQLDIKQILRHKPEMKIKENYNNLTRTIATELIFICPLKMY